MPVSVNVAPTAGFCAHDHRRLILQRLHLLGRRTFLADHHAPDKAAVARRAGTPWEPRRTAIRCRPCKRPRSAPRSSGAAETTTAICRKRAAPAFRRAPPARSTQFCLMPCPRGFSRRAHISGVSVSETRPEAMIETTMVIANSRKMRPTSPDMNTSGKNTAASDTVMDRMVKLISRALSQRRLQRFQSSLHQAHRVFQKHDGVVHQESDRQRQRHQREVVQAVAQDAHGHERQQQRQAATPRRESGCRWRGQER